MKTKILLFGIVFLLFISSVNATLLDSIQFYHSTDDADTSGTIAIDSSGQYNGTLVNGVASGVSGQLNEAYSFDNINDVVTTTLTQSQSQAFSGSFWFYLDDTTNDNDAMLSLYTAGANYAMLIHKNLDGGLGIQVGDGATHKSSFISVSATTWTHVVVTFDGTNSWKVYKNGINVINWTQALGAATYQINYGAFAAAANPFNGDLDEVGYWHKVLNQTEIDTLYNSGTGYNPYGTTPTSDFKLNSYSLEDDSQLLIFNTTINETDFLSTTNGTINTGLYVNDTKLYNFSVSASNHFTGYFYDVNVSNTPLALNLTQYPYVVLYNDWNGSQLSNYSITINGTTYTNETGTTLYVPYNATFNVTINKSGYLLRTIEWDFSNSNDLNTTIWQSEININAYEVITNNTINTWNITTDQGILSTSTQNISFKPNKGVYSWTSRSSGYWNLTETFNVSSDYTNFSVIFYTHLLNVSIYKLGGGLVDNVNFELVALNYTYNLSVSSTGYYEFGLLNGSYFITADPSGYAITNATFNISSNETYKAVNFTVATTNSIDFYFYDEETKNLIDYETITLELIGEYVAYNATTTTGNYFIDLITPDTYAIRYSASSYEERYYYFTLVNRTTNTLNLYLLNSSSLTSVTATVYDQNNNVIEDAYIKVMRYDITTNSYIIMDIAKTNFEGEATLHLVLHSELYKFIIEYPYGTVELTTDPTEITKSAIEFQLILGDLAAQDFYNSEGVASTLIFNNATNNFDYDYFDSQNTVIQGCLEVYRITGLGETLVNQTCSESSSSSISLGVQNVSGATYKANAYVYFSSTPYYLKSAWHTFPENVSFGVVGLFLAALLVFVFGIIGYYAGGAPAAAILAPVPVFLGSLLHIIDVDRSVGVGLMAASMIIAIIVGKEF